MSASIARVALHSRSSSTLWLQLSQKMCPNFSGAQDKNKNNCDKWESEEEIPLSWQFLSHFSPSSRVKCHIIRLISFLSHCCAGLKAATHHFYMAHTFHRVLHSTLWYVILRSATPTLASDLLHASLRIDFSFAHYSLRRMYLDRNDTWFSVHGWRLKGWKLLELRKNLIPKKLG